MWSHGQHAKFHQRPPPTDEYCQAHQDIRQQAKESRGVNKSEYILLYECHQYLELTPSNTERAITTSCSQIDLAGSLAGIIEQEQPVLHGRWYFSNKAKKCREEFQVQYMAPRKKDLTKAHVR